MRLLINTILFYTCFVFFAYPLIALLVAWSMGFSLHMGLLLAFSTIGLDGNTLADISPYFFVLVMALLTVNRASAIVLSNPQGDGDACSNSAELLGTSPVRDQPN
jgi:hypothetical protein